VQLVIATLLSIAALAGDNHVAWNVKPKPKSVHTFQVFNGSPIFL